MQSIIKETYIRAIKIRQSERNSIMQNEIAVVASFTVAPENVQTLVNAIFGLNGQISVLSADLPKPELTMHTPTACQPTAAPAPVAAPPAPVAPNAPAPAPAPMAPPAYSLGQMSRAAAGLMDAGKQQDLIALLARFGVQAMTQLDKAQYGEFAAALQQLGAKL